VNNFPQPGPDASQKAGQKAGSSSHRNFRSSNSQSVCGKLDICLAAAYIPFKFLIVR
jgi:hypothetical protein